MVDQDKLEKFKVVYSSYNEVNSLDRYEDSKAERGLQALAFITLSGVTIFAASLYILTILHRNLTLFITSYTFFGIFIVLISIGTIFILYGIKPRFNIPKSWDGTEPKSIFFYREIASLQRDKWIQYISGKTTDQLLDKAISDLTFETHLIAEKIGKKVKWTKCGFLFYLISVVSMVIMTITMIVLAVVTA